MADYNVTAPDGSKYKVTAPDGATQDQIVAFAKQSAEQQAQKSPSWSDIPGQALRNLPNSAGNFISSMAQPFLHPIDTATAIKNVAQGGLEKAGVLSGSEHKQYADAVGKMLKDRYGSVENFKQTLATDPVGVAADLSTILTGGGALAERAPGIIGDIGKAASTAGKVTNPLSAAINPVTGKVASEIAGVTTGAGGQTIRTAYRAGQQGGAPAKAFRDTLTESEPVEQVVTDARSAVSKLRSERGKEYQAAMAKMGQTAYQILDFKDIDKAVGNTVSKFKGVSVSPSTEKVQGELAGIVNEWKSYAPAQYHTAEGLDALKKRVGDVMENLPYNTPQRLAAEKVYNAVKDTIVKQAPEYATIMKGYQEASDQIRAIEKELSVNPKANIDTALRKITSALRDNVNTNFGRRRELVEFLARSGAPHLLEKIAGQALKALMPQGLARLAVSGEGAGTLWSILHGDPTLAASLLTTIAGHSPRLIGEAAYGLGKSAAPIRDTGLGSFQAGRLSSAPDMYQTQQIEPLLQALGTQ